MATPVQLAMGLDAPHRNRYLFSDHYLNTLLPTDPRWAEALPEATDVLAWLQELYGREQAQLAHYNESQTGRALVQTDPDPPGPRLRTAGQPTRPGDRNQAARLCLFRRPGGSPGRLIGQPVYRPYGLTDEEIELVEGKLWEEV